MAREKKRELDEDGFVIRENKEASKRERDEAKDFVRELLKLPSVSYADLPIDQSLRLALIEGKRLTNNALKRHLSYLARLILEQDIDSIRDQYNRVSHPYRNDLGKIKQVENYKARLLEGDTKVISELLERFLDIDVQYLRQLVRNANKEIQKREDKNKQAALLGDKLNHKQTKSESILTKYLSSCRVR